MLRYPVLFFATVILSCILWPAMLGMVLGVLAVFALKAIISRCFWPFLPGVSSHVRWPFLVRSATKTQHSQIN